jgi:hypothetical protein
MIAASVALIQKGWAPFCPGQDMLYFLYLRPGESISEAVIKMMSMAWLDVSDAILLLPGWQNSSGAVAEKERAETLGRAIFYTVEDVPFSLEA